ncbi:MAG: hypothetical protein IT384_03510 [Deltaproteobacteria bacterium]|nr:hypothetical protein [Deltaproteobacteria bacterium]
MSLQPDSEAPAWMPSDLPAELLSLRVAPGWTCSTFNSTWQTRPNTSGEATGLAVRLGPDEALIATESGRFFRVETASVAELDLPSGTPRAAGFADPETGEIWLIGRDGRVVRGRPESGFRAAPSLPPGLGAPWGVDGRRGDAPLELFVQCPDEEVLAPRRAPSSRSHAAILSKPGSGARRHRPELDHPPARPLTTSRYQRPLGDHRPRRRELSSKPETDFAGMFRAYGYDVGRSGAAAQMLPALAETAETSGDLKRVEDAARHALSSRFDVDVPSGREAMRVIARRSRHLGLL